MQRIDEIIQPRWLIPVDEEHSILESHAVALDGGKIIALGPAEEIRSRYEADTLSRRDHHALIPGLVNAHTHAAMTLFRGFADDLPLMQWLREHIWPAEQRWVDPGFVECGTNLAIAEMIRGGTTCFNDMYFFPDTVAGCAEEAGIRACVGMIVIDFPTAWARDATEYLDKGVAFHRQVRDSSLVTAAFAPHAPYTVSDAPLRNIAALSEELDCPVHIHLHETAHEVEESVSKHGIRPIERLDRLGLLGPRLLAVHMTQLLPEEIRTIAERGVHVVHCAESNLKLASGFCPVAELHRADARVCLGTDGASSNNDLDMLGELRTASLLAKGVGGDPTALNAYQSLQAATVNGARGLGLGAVTGSIQAGKSADVVAIDLSHCSTEPVYNPVSQIVYSATRDQVSDVWIAGRQVLHNREFTSLDYASVRDAAIQWRNKISA
ncbi:MAG: TRZ/ATZ family hydrolase [Gammaproteobacteria bacterium]|nr:TRZ/ATZ family hydrolase [Gammaproteobacteria bacterium]